MTELVRKNIRMSPEIAKYYEDKAKELGISQSAMMVIALNEYIKQEKAINSMSNFDNMLKQKQKAIPSRDLDVSY